MTHSNGRAQRRTRRTLHHHDRCRPRAVRRRTPTDSAGELGPIDRRPHRRRLVGRRHRHRGHAHARARMRVEQPRRLAAEVVVIDDSTATSGPRSDIYARALRRTPRTCYVAQATVLARKERPDGIILVAEPKRSLTARDVTDVLDVPAVATVEASPYFAGTIDAGLLVSRVHRLRELAPLGALASDPYAGRLRPSTAHSRQRRTPLSKVDTDLPFAQSANSGEFRRARQRGHSEPVEPTVTTSRPAAPVRKARVAAIGASAEPLVRALAGDAQRRADIGPRGTIAFPRPRDLDSRDPVRDLGELKSDCGPLEPVGIRPRELSDQATRFADDTLIGHSTARHDRHGSVRTTPMSGPH